MYFCTLFQTFWELCLGQSETCAALQQPWPLAAVSIDGTALWCYLSLLLLGLGEESIGARWKRLLNLEVLLSSEPDRLLLIFTPWFLFKKPIRGEVWEVDWKVCIETAYNVDIFNFFYFLIWGKEFNQNNSGEGKKHTDLEEQGTGHLAEHAAR